MLLSLSQRHLACAAAILTTTQAYPYPSQDHTTSTHRPNPWLPTQATLLPTADWDINLHDYTNIVPSTPFTLNYAETYPSHKALVLTFTTAHPALIPENSAFMSHVTCSDDHRSMNIVLADDVATELAAEWPEEDMLVVTNTPSCNDADERGLYLVTATAHLDYGSIRLRVERKAWEDISDSVEIRRYK